MNFVDAKLLWRDWRGGQLNLIVSALVLAVMVVTAVSLLADRVERGINQQITAFLAADLALRAGAEIEQKYFDQGAQLGLQTAKTAQFRSMVFSGDYSHLASVKAVEPAYPLRGLIELSGNENPQISEKLANGPASGEVWVEPRLLNLLEIQLGDSIEVGYSNLRVSRIILNEPDRGTGFSVAGARVLMNYEDLAASQLIRPGSRITYKMLMAGEEQQVNSFRNWYRQQNGDDEGSENGVFYRLQTPERSEERLSEALERGRAFLLLSGTIGVLLAGLAMALASHRYATRLTDQVALMKAWGQPSKSIRHSQFLRLLMIAAGATAMGVLLGWLAHYLLLEVAREFFKAELPLPGWRPWAIAILTGFVCVLGFALPALWHLPAIAPLKVLRRDLPDDLVSQGQRLVIGISALLALTFWYSGSIVISVLFLGALFALFGICALIAMQILKVVQGFGQWRGSYIRLGLANLWRRRAQTLVQLVGFSTTLLLLLVVVGLRTNLIAEWEAQLPETTPSHFLFNVSGNELQQVKDLLVEEGVQAGTWFPMVRGRLIGLNGQTLTTQRLRRADGIDREVNFTQSAGVPSENGIVAGQWWPGPISDTDQDYQFSIEQEVAEQLGVGLGDEIEFSIGGITFTARLTSIRSVDWQSMNPNFYIVFRPGMLDRFAPNWITSLREIQPASAQEGPFIQSAPFVSKIIRQYPAAVVLELGQIVEQIRSVINRVTQGLELILMLVLACGALVLFAAIGVSFDERLRENAVLRTLGSSRKVVIGALTTEFAVLGLIAGFIASFGAEIILYFVQLHLFDMQPGLHPQLWGLGILSGVIIITVLGLLRSREIITVPPLQSLRQIA
ncbi:MAG: FtsX-like permease family protein [Acidiferrobacterales bacterium]|nr:FtsX-like permease family protein [Acidiferrobacterales bacterium]